MNLYGYNLKLDKRSNVEYKVSNNSLIFKYLYGINIMVSTTIRR